MNTEFCPDRPLRRAQATREGIRVRKKPRPGAAVSALEYVHWNIGSERQLWNVRFGMYRP
jgi:hypothetical protein